MTTIKNYAYMVPKKQYNLIRMKKYTNELIKKRMK